MFRIIRESAALLAICGAGAVMLMWAMLATGGM
jgi:hypothetical protein